MRDIARGGHAACGRTAAACAVASLVALLAAGGAAASPLPCAQAVIADWSDGGVDGVYPAACYRQALAVLPEDMSAYTSAPDDIARALRATLAARAGRPTGRDQARGVRGEPARSLQSGSGPRRNSSMVLPTQRSPAATSLPVPVLLLAGVVVLVGLGALAGLLARRLRRRRLAQSVAFEVNARRARSLTP